MSKKTPDGKMTVSIEGDLAASEESVRQLVRVLEETAMVLRRDVLKELFD